MVEIKKIEENIINLSPITGENNIKEYIEKEIIKKLKKDFNINIDGSTYDNNKFIVDEKNGKFIVEFPKTNVEKVKEVKNVKNIFNLKLKDVVIFKNEFYKLNSSLETLIDFIINNYDKFLDYPSFNEKEWMEYLADHSVSIKQIKGRIVKLTYKPVDYWYGDGFKNDNNIRSGVENYTVTKVLLYDKEMDYEKAVEFANFVLNSHLFEKLEKEKIEVDIEEFEKEFKNKMKSKIQEVIKKIKEEYDYKFCIEKIKEINSNAILSPNDELYNLYKKIANFNISYKYNKYYFEVINILRDELVEAYNKMIGNIEYYKIKIGRDIFHLFIPKKLKDKGTLYIKSLTYKNGLIIGKGGENIKEIAKKVGVKKIILKKYEL